MEDRSIEEICKENYIDKKLFNELLDVMEKFIAARITQTSSKKEDSDTLITSVVTFSKALSFLVFSVMRLFDKEKQDHIFSLVKNLIEVEMDKLGDIIKNERT